MFIAMNRFKIKKGMEQDFIDIWKQRDTYLSEVPGFKAFHLLQSGSGDEYTLFASHSVWNSEEDFENWTKSEAFAKAHANAGTKTKDVYLGPPQLELFKAVI